MAKGQGQGQGKGKSMGGAWRLPACPWAPCSTVRSSAPRGLRVLSAKGAFLGVGASRLSENYILLRSSLACFQTCTA